LHLDRARYAVSGTAWMDHEWFTGALDPSQVGWDWFSVQLDDGRELMLMQLRTKAGTIDPHSSGTYVDKQGQAHHLMAHEFSLEPARYWASGKSKARYPVSWRIRVPSLGLNLQCEAAVDGQLAGARIAIAPHSIVLLDTRSYPVSVRPEDGRYRVEIEGESHVAATDWRPGEVLLRIRAGKRLATVQIERLPGAAFRLMHAGVIRRAQVLSPRAAELLALMPEKQAADTSRLLLSPMPGLLSSVTVSQGQEVKTGEPLAIVEAMKMENILRAERDGRIARIRAHPGDSLAVDQVILEFE